MKEEVISYITQYYPPYLCACSNSVWTTLFVANVQLKARQIFDYAGFLFQCYGVTNIQNAKIQYAAVPKFKLQYKDLKRFTCVCGKGGTWVFCVSFFSHTPVFFSQNRKNNTYVRKRLSSVLFGWKYDVIKNVIAQQRIKIQNDKGN